MTAPALTGNRCQCPTCGEVFNSLSVFDRHRVGSFEGPASACARRCLSVVEMAARGWSRNGAGYWIERRREGSTVRVQGPRVGWAATGAQGATA
jgi:hypothetical protein